MANIKNAKGINENAKRFAEVKGVEIEVFHKLNIVQYTNEKSRLCSAIWDGKRKKPSWHYIHQNEAQRQQHIKERKESEQYYHNLNQQWKAKMLKDREDTINNTEIGDIFSSSWGYEQTNINFYQVVGKKGKQTFLLRELAQDRTPDSDMSGKTMPRKDDFRDDEVYEKRVTSSGGFKISEFQTARKWDGEPEEYTSYA